MSEHKPTSDPAEYAARIRQRDADRYRQARDLCGGEDPVEWIGRMQRGMGESVIHVITQRDSLLDLVQRLLDHSPGGRHPYFLIGTEKLPEVLLPDERWDPLREEARARVAELRKGEGDGQG